MRLVLPLQILVSALLLILSFPRPGLGWVSVFAFVPLLKGLSGVSSRKAFLAGWGTGILWFFVSYNWVSHSVHDFGGISFPVAEGIILLLAGVHGLYVALFAALVPLVAGTGTHGIGVSEYRGDGVITGRMKRFAGHPLVPVLVLPSAWVLLEVARTWFPAPFPWLLMGTAVWNIPLMGTLYATSGVYGVSFWILSVNVLFWMILRTPSPARIWMGMILAVLLSLPVVLAPFTTKGTDVHHLTVGVIQGNIKQELKWDESMREKTLQIYLSLTDEAVRKGAKLVVWPETAVPEFFQAAPSLEARLKQYVSNHNVHLIFGSPGYETRGPDILLYNRVYHLAPDGKEEFYDKNILVPFGEYVPLGHLLPFIDKLVPGEGEFARGVFSGPFQTPVPSGPLICFEISFPSLARREVRDGSSMLINVTNDAWFGRTWGPYQHLAIATVRAMENRVPVLRAANTGISAVIDRKGHIVDSIGLDRRGFLVATVETGTGKTLYTRFGDWIVIPSAAVVSVYLLILLITWRPYKWTR